MVVSKLAGRKFRVDYCSLSSKPQNTKLHSTNGINTIANRDYHVQIIVLQFFCYFPTDTSIYDCCKFATIASGWSSPVLKMSANTTIKYRSIPVNRRKIIFAKTKSALFTKRKVQQNFKSSKLLSRKFAAFFNV